MDDMNTTLTPAVSDAAAAAPAAATAAAGAAAHPLQRLPVTLEPHRNLLKYYLLSALAFGPAFFMAVFPFYFRYRTLRYDVDAEGITMRWGILFRREVSLTYARIQDIQLSSNVVERWLGLARIQLQTASGSATAEMTIEGIRDVDAMRDFFYSRMRGVKAATPAGGGGGAVSAPAVAAASLAPSGVEELTVVLDAVADEVRALRAELARGRAAAGRNE
jgi:membrane protein YdbS with pleckstrin-like domain